MPTKSVKLNVLTSGVDRAISDMTKLSASKSDLSKGATIRLTLQDADLTAEKLDALKLQVKTLSDKGADIRIKLEGAGTAESELAALGADAEGLSLSGAKVSGSLKNAGTEAAGFGTKLKTALGGAIGMGALGGLAIGLGLSAKVALDAQSSIALLGNAIHDAGGSIKTYQASINSTEDSMAKFGYTGSQVDTALTTLIHATGSVSQSESVMATAADLATARHISLTSAVSMLAKASGGAMRGMKDLGITQVTGATQAKAMDSAQKTLADQISTAGGIAEFAAAHNMSLAKATQLVTQSASGNIKAMNELGIVVLPKTATAAQRLAQIQQVLNEKLGGAAAAQAATFQGKMAALRAEFTNIAERIGIAVLPALTELLGVFVKVAACKPAVTVLTAAVGLLAISFIGLKIAALLAGDGMKTALISSGVGLILLGIGIAIMVLMEHWRGLETGVKDVMHAIQSVVMDVFDWFKTHWPLLVGIMGGPIGIAAVQITEHFHAMQSGVSTVWNAIWGALVSPVVHAFNSVKNAITSGFDGWWKSHGDETKQVWRVTWTAVSDIFKAIFNPIINVAKTDISNLTSVFRVGSSAIRPIWSGIWTALSDIFKVFAAGVSWYARAFWTQVTITFKSSLAIITDLFKFEFYFMEEIVVSVFNVIKAIIKIVWDVIVGIFNVSLDLITGHWSKAWQDMLNVGTQIANSIKSMINTFTGWIGQHFASAGTWLVNAGRDLIQGLFNGATAIISTVGSWVSNIGNRIISAVKNFFGIHSPSSVFMDIGKNMMLGLLKGIIMNNPATMISKLLGGMPTMFKDLLLGGFIKNITAMGANAIKLIQGWGSSALGALGKAGSAIGGFFSSIFGGGGSGGGVLQWKNLVDIALMLNNLPDSLDARVLYQMQTESGGNPNAINLTDSNAQAGDPSRGLLQTIMSTFMAYHIAGTSNNIYDPLANIAAAINYAKHVYGPSLMSGGMGMGSGHGYFAGGIIPELVLGMGMVSGSRYSFGERGPELVTPMGGRTNVVGGGDNININIGIATDPNATAQAIHQMLRRYKTKKGGGPLGLA